MADKVIASEVEINKNLFNVTDKVAVVTGAGRGMGRAVSCGLATFGANVVVTDVDLANAEETASIVRKLGRKAIAIKLDVGDFDQANKMTAAAIKEFDRIDILVNNAGFLSRTTFFTITPEDLQKTMSVNFGGVVNCSQAVAGQMIKQQSGSIINVGSSWSTRIGVFNRNAGSPGYSASKAAVQAFTRSTAATLAEYGIRANAIAPGIVDSPMHTENRERIVSTFVPLMPLGRLQGVSDIVGAVVFLASDAGVYVTGQVIHINGGIIMTD